MKELKQVLWTIAKVVILATIVTTSLYLLQKPGFKETLIDYMFATFEFIDHVLSFKRDGAV